MHANLPIDLRTGATTLAAALALALCGCSQPEPEARPVAEAPIEADAEARLPHLVRPVIVEAPADEAPDPGIDKPGTRPADEADRESREAALRYMARRDGVSAPPPATRQPPSPVAAVPAPAAPPRPAAAVARPPESRSTEPTGTVASARRAAPVEAPPAPPRAEPIAGDARSLNQQAIALIGAGRPERAIHALERAVALQPRDAEMLGNLGYAYLLAGDPERARSQFVRSLDLAPTRSATWLNLGQAYAELGEREVAVDAVVKGYRYSTRKPSVRSALERAAGGSRFSPAWREAAGRALDRIDSRT